MKLATCPCCNEGNLHVTQTFPSFVVCSKNECDYHKILGEYVIEQWDNGNSINFST